MLSNISKLYHYYHFGKNTQLLEKKANFSLHFSRLAAWLAVLDAARTHSKTAEIFAYLGWFVTCFLCSISAMIG